ncbi:MAG: trehalose-phosphatase [Gemmatimonadota bacterium]
MDPLEIGLRRVAATDRLLVASDFDGTLAGIVDHPDAVTPDRPAVAALQELAELPATWVAVLSGRSRAVLEEHLGHAGLALVGSHGAELQGIELGGMNFDGDLPDGPGAAADPELIRRTLDEAATALDDLANEYEGALVERKPTAVAFHYRKVDPSRQNEAAARAAALADGSDLLRIQPGHMVIELVSGRVNKGDALDTLRRALDPTATVFVGDDRTDEHAFARLGPGDLAVKIGPGDTCAPVRIASQSDVAPLFRRLRTLRAVRAIPTP